MSKKLVNIIEDLEKGIQMEQLAPKPKEGEKEDDQAE